MRGGEWAQGRLGATGPSCVRELPCRQGPEGSGAWGGSGGCALTANPPAPQCCLACHKKCLETLAIQCGHKKLQGRLQLFGQDFSQAARDTPDGVPFILKKCICEIERRALRTKVPSGRRPGPAPRGAGRRAQQRLTAGAPRAPRRASTA